MQALDAAMEGGGSVLGTGDQCGRDTPEANITKLVEVREKRGKY
jgi:uroporphyrinogen decarboxylase